MGGLRASPSWASHLLCDLSMSLTLSGPHFSDFIPSSRIVVQSNMVDNSTRWSSSFVFNIYLDKTFVKLALGTNKVGIFLSIVT